MTDLGSSDATITDFSFNQLQQCIQELMTLIDEYEEMCDDTTPIKEKAKAADVVSVNNRSFRSRIYGHNLLLFIK